MATAHEEKRRRSVSVNKPEVYIASSLKNCKLNSEVAGVLEKAGLSCFLPQRDAIETKLREARETNNGHEAEVARAIRLANVEAIYTSTVVLAIARNLGRDTAWECGFATALDKPLVLLFDNSDLNRTDSPEETYMLYHSLPEDSLLLVPNYRREILKPILQREFALDNLPARLHRWTPSHCQSSLAPGSMSALPSAILPER